MKKRKNDNDYIGCVKNYVLTYWFLVDAENNYARLITPIILLKFEPCLRKCDYIFLIPIYFPALFNFFVFLACAFVYCAIRKINFNQPNYYAVEKCKKGIVLS